MRAHLEGVLETFLICDTATLVDEGDEDDSDQEEVGVENALGEMMSSAGRGVREHLLQGDHRREDRITRGEEEASKCCSEGQGGVLTLRSQSR